MFTKEDLKPGMLCELGSGAMCLALPDRDGDLRLWTNGGLNCETSTMSMAGDMKNALGYSEYDVVRVCGLFRGGDPFDIENRDLLWERVTPKEMTLSQIEEALGYPVKIVKEEK